MMLQLPPPCRHYDVVFASFLSETTNGRRAENSTSTTIVRILYDCILERTYLNLGINISIQGLLFSRSLAYVLLCHLFLLWRINTKLTDYRGKRLQICSYSSVDQKFPFHLTFDTYIGTASECRTRQIMERIGF